MARWRRPLTSTIAAGLLAFIADSAIADVRFGRNVYTGGHDVSKQTFNAKRRGLYVIHAGKPKREGCVWRTNGDGSTTKVCHLHRRIR